MFVCTEHYVHAVNLNIAKCYYSNLFFDIIEGHQKRHKPNYLNWTASPKDTVRVHCWQMLMRKHFFAIIWCIQNKSFHNTDLIILQLIYVH